MYSSHVCSSLFFFFFFKQKTAYEMRISDWSSDVCSSDLMPLQVVERHMRGLLDRPVEMRAADERAEIVVSGLVLRLEREPIERRLDALGHVEIGRASCRERVCQYV